MPKLIEQTRPIVLRALKRSAEIKYPSSYRMIIASLESVDRYRDLTIDQVNTLITFLPQELHPDGRTDFYYGDYILLNEYQL